MAYDFPDLQWKSHGKFQNNGRECHLAGVDTSLRGRDGGDNPMRHRPQVFGLLYPGHWQYGAILLPGGLGSGPPSRVTLKDQSVQLVHRDRVTAVQRPEACASGDEEVEVQKLAVAGPGVPTQVEEEDGGREDVGCQGGEQPRCAGEVGRGSPDAEISRTDAAVLPTHPPIVRLRRSQPSQHVCRELGAPRTRTRICP